MNTSSGGKAGSGRGLPPTLKRLGQHFLSDPRVLARIVKAMHLTGSETVVEIGPGRGAMTDMLADRCARLYAIELDRALAAMLRERYQHNKRVTIIEADALNVDLATLAGGPFRLVGNVPYYITTPLIFQALKPPRADISVFLVQKEVALRAAAAAGSDEYGALSVNVQVLAKVEVLFEIPPGAFSPPPKVDSAVIRLTPLEASPVLPEEERRFRTLVQGAFTQRRKQMRRVLRSTQGLSVEQAEGALEIAGIEPTVRPETLSPVTFVRLLRAIPEVRPLETDG